jgi:uncharacterized protein (DUF362 family)
MSNKLTRRDLLSRGLGAAGVLAGARLPLAWAAPQPARRPDRSARAPSLPVAIQRCESYEPQLLRRTLDEALELIGGIRKLVQNKTVTVKLNLTGGQAGKIGGLEPYQTYHSHPKMVAALCAALHDNGARRTVLVEGQYSLKPAEETLAGWGWDVRAIQSAGGNRVEFVDTRNRGPFPKYSRFNVPDGGFVYPAFDLNQAYEKTDVFVSLNKMKDHACAGVTLTVKNLFGITPQALYGDDAPNENSLNARGRIFHSGDRKPPAGVPAELDHGWPAGQWQHRIPGITADLFMARPCDLAIIDGIETNRGGEGPWIGGVAPVQPKLILVGRNGVCTDAIGTAAMGYDPLADHNQFPFQGDNHLRLLASAGVGAIDPKRIEVRGLAMERAVFPFNPQRMKVKAPVGYYYRPCAGQRRDAVA